MKSAIPATLAILSAACGLAFSTTAAAQSTGNVTLYGIVDQSVRYQTNSNANNDALWQVANGAVTNSRFGFKGTEDLGGGMKAIFQLESGINPQNGTLANGPRLFDRYAFVGLQNQYGTIKIGRQATEAFNVYGDFDPLTIGNYANNSWMYNITRGRVDNAVSYAGTFGGLSVGATYGFGNTAGTMAASNYWGARAAYAMGPFQVAGVYQQARDAAKRVQQMWGLGGIYSVSIAKVFVGYMGGRDRSGWLDGTLNDPAHTVTTGNLNDNPRKDTTLYLGTTIQAMPNLAITGAAYFDDIKNINAQAGDAGSGRRYTYVLLAEYALSKRTQLYGTVDYNKVSGAARVELPGNSTQVGVGTGIRHIF
ncbi:porin [Pandoraea sputorum]